MSRFSFESFSGIVKETFESEEVTNINTKETFEPKEVTNNTNSTGPRFDLPFQRRTRYRLTNWRVHPRYDSKNCFRGLTAETEKMNHWLEQQIYDVIKVTMD